MPQRTGIPARGYGSACFVDVGTRSSTALSRAPDGCHPERTECPPLQDEGGTIELVELDAAVGRSCCVCSPCLDVLEEQRPVA